MCLPRGVLEVGRPSVSTKEGTRRFQECREIQAQQRGGWRVTSPGRVMGLFLVGCIIKLGKWHVFLETEAHPSWCLQAVPELVEAIMAGGFPQGPHFLAGSAKPQVTCSEPCPAPFCSKEVSITSQESPLCLLCTWTAHHVSCPTSPGGALHQHHPPNAAPAAPRPQHSARDTDKGSQGHWCSW